MRYLAASLLGFLFGDAMACMIGDSLWKDAPAEAAIAVVLMAAFVMSVLAIVAVRCVSK